MKTIRLVGILLMVFVKSIHRPHVSEVDAQTVATGIMGLMVRTTFLLIYIVDNCTACAHIVGGSS